VFRVLRDPEKAAALEKLLRLTPFARTEFESATRDNISQLSELEMVRLTVFPVFRRIRFGIDKWEVRDRLSI